MEQQPTITNDDMQRIEHALKQQINTGDVLRQELHSLVSAQVAEELIETRASITTAVQTAEEAKAAAASLELNIETMSTEMKQHIASLQNQYHEFYSLQRVQNQDALSLAQRLSGLTERVADNITVQDSAQTMLKQQLATLHENVDTQNRTTGESIEALSAKIEQSSADSARQYGEHLALVNRQMAQLQKRINIVIIMFTAVLLISYLIELLGK